MARNCLFVIALLWLAAGTGSAHAQEDVNGEPVIEFHRYSLKMMNRDRTPLVRVYETGLVHVYHSAFSPLAGVYEHTLNDQELAALFDLILAGGLDQISSLELAAVSEQAEINRRQAGELYYTSDHTISALRVRLPGARSDRLMIENLQDTDSRFSGLPGISEFADFERRMLKLAEGGGGRRIGEPTPVEELRL